MKKQLFVGIILLHAGALLSMDNFRAIDKELSDIDDSKETPAAPRKPKAQSRLTKNGGIQKPHAVRDKKVAAQEMAQKAAERALITDVTLAFLNQYSK